MKRDEPRSIGSPRCRRWLAGAATGLLCGACARLASVPSSTLTTGRGTVGRARHRPSTPDDDGVAAAVGLGRARPYRIASCACLHWARGAGRNVATCVPARGGGGPSDDDDDDVLGEFRSFAPVEPFGKRGRTSRGNFFPVNFTEKLSRGQHAVLRPGDAGYDDVEARNLTCDGIGSGASSSSTAFVEVVVGQFVNGIYHQWLAGLLPMISMILGICDGTVGPIDRRRFDPTLVDRWVINLGTWNGEKMRPYVAEIWDAVRPRLREACGNASATFELLRTKRNVDVSGTDPYPPPKDRGKFVVGGRGHPATLLAFYNHWTFQTLDFYVLRPAHAELIRDAVLGAKRRRGDRKKRSRKKEELTVIVVDRKHSRRIEYDGAETNRTNGTDGTSANLKGGRALLQDVAAWIESTPAPNGELYSVASTRYTNDLGKENQTDFVSDADVILWTHGQQQANVLWAPECSVTLDLLANRQYVNIYNVASVQTGHVYGYVYSLRQNSTRLPRTGTSHAGLAEWPKDYGLEKRYSIRGRTVPVCLSPVKAALPELLRLRWRCLERGFAALPVPNLTRQHVDFVLGEMGETKSVYARRPTS